MPWVHRQRAWNPKQSKNASAVQLAADTADYERFRTAYHEAFRRTIGCDSRETVPAVFGLLRLAEGDPRRAIPFGANFGRDTDTIATMVGAICGALGGIEALPAEWVRKIEADEGRDQRALAERLVRVALDKATSEVASWQWLNDASV